jgi:hypothetical protein
MAVTIHLPSEAEDALERKAQAEGLSKESYAQRVLERELGLEAGASSGGLAAALAITERIRQKFQGLSDEPFDPPRPDGASQHDHYIYGAPKRDDL